MVAAQEQVVQVTPARKRSRHGRGRQVFTVSALAIVAVYFLVAILGPLIIPYDPVATNTGDRLLPPGATTEDGGTAHFGTDQMGRDVFAQTIYGTRTSLIVAVTALAIQLVIGILVGLLAGYYGKWVDGILMRLSEIQQVFPNIVLAILLAAVLGSGMLNVIIVLGITGWVTVARVVRAQVMAVKNLQHVDAARMMGARTWYLFRVCILPACTMQIVVIATLDIGGVILAEASLSFLGLGVPAQMASWGGVIASGRDYLASSWWISTIPGIVLAVLVVALGIIGDHLRDRIDPNLKGSH